jgi:hypothetical protein
MAVFFCPVTLLAQNKTLRAAAPMRLFCYRLCRIIFIFHKIIYFFTSHSHQRAVPSSVLPASISLYHNPKSRTTYRTKAPCTTPASTTQLLQYVLSGKWGHASFLSATASFFWLCMPPLPLILLLTPVLNTKVN